MWSPSKKVLLSSQGFIFKVAKSPKNLCTKSHSLQKSLSRSVPQFGFMLLISTVTLNIYPFTSESGIGPWT